MKTRQLQQFYWDWLSTGERLLRTLAEQTAALTLRDLTRVEAIQPEIDRLQLVMSAIDEKAGAATKELAEELGVEPRLRSIVAVLNPAEARQLTAMSTRVKAVADNLKERLFKNRKLIESELAYVGGTLAIVAQAAMEDSSRFAVVPKESPVLVNQVA